MRQYALQDRFTNDAPQKVLGYGPLIVKAEKFLDFAETQVWIVSGKTVVELQEQTVQLCDDNVFIVARIADEGALRFGRILAAVIVQADAPRQISSSRIG